MYNFNHELDVSDFDSCLARPENTGIGRFPQYLLEAAKKAGKQYNFTTKRFESIEKKNGN